MKRVLIVDDNDVYAKNLTNYLKSLKFTPVRAKNAEEGWKKYQKNPDFHSIISDITMETQTSGLWLMRRIFKDGFRGNMLIATTGFDVFGVLFLSKYFLPIFAGIGWMIPKKPLKMGEVIFFPTFTKKNTSFISVI